MSDLKHWKAFTLQPNPKHIVITDEEPQCELGYQYVNNVIATVCLAHKDAAKNSKILAAAPEALEMLKTLLGAEHGKPKPNKARISRIQAILEKAGVCDE